MALDAARVDLATVSMRSMESDLYIDFYTDSPEDTTPEVITTQGTVHIRCRQAGTTETAALSISTDRLRLGLGSTKDKAIVLAAVKQLRAVRFGLDDVQEPGFGNHTDCWTMTVVYVAWGRLKQLDLEFSDREDYNIWLDTLVQLCPQAQVLHLPASRPVIPRLALGTPVSLSPRLYRFSPRKQQPASPKAFGQRPGNGVTYTMPTSPLARRRTASAGKGRRGGPCLFPCLMPAGDVDKLPLEVGAGHPHLELADYKQMYDVGKQYDRVQRSGATNDHILAHK